MKKNNKILFLLLFFVRAEKTSAMRNPFNYEDVQATQQKISLVIKGIIETREKYFVMLVYQKKVYTLTVGESSPSGIIIESIHKKKSDTRYPSYYYIVNFNVPGHELLSMTFPRQE